MGILFSLATIVMYINTEKMASRNTPFLPEDLAMSGEAGGLASMINLERFLNMLFTIVVIIIITIIVNKISKKIWHFKFSKKQKIAIFIPQIALILICAHFLNLHTLEIRNLSGKGTFIKVENLETSIDFTDQAYNYRTNGFILATISNLQTKTQKQPEGYSKEAVQKIVEFEALTGLSNFFLNSIPYTSIVPANKDTPSIVKNFNENGYKTIAMHPYNRNMYCREVVYPNLGFQEYKSADGFKNNSKIDNSKYISDESAFNEVLTELKNSQKPEFIHLVTMQNHMPYEENAYSEHNFSINAKNGANPENAKTVQAYLEGISRSDKAMKNFLSEIEKLNEKTIVVFWGDHWPGIYGEMFEKELNKNDIRRTPLFVYSNFKKEKQDLGTSSLIYNQILALNAFNSKLSPFQYLLSDLREKYPALTKQFVKIDEKSDILKDFEMIEYDILSGNKYSLGNFYKIK